MPTPSNNVGKQQYNWNWSQPVTSYLYDNGNGLTRVEYISDYLLVEDYDPEFHLTNSRTLDLELPLWGGFYAGEQANFVITGQTNPQESDSTEVIHVVKYDKSWNRLGQASLFGANTVSPFDAGSLRCTEHEGLLYIRTCHKMYRSEDGLNHQANLTMIVNQETMELTDAFYEVFNISGQFGYVSHSFNQFTLADAEGNIVNLDHGDAYPRALVLTRLDSEARQTGAPKGIVSIRDFPGEAGNNVTGAEVGGFAETTSGYVTAYSYRPHLFDATDETKNQDEKKIFVSYVPKDLSTVKTADLSTGTNLITPVLAQTGLGGGYVLWNLQDLQTLQESDSLSYVTYQADGTVSPVRRAKGLLSDCQPIPYQDGIIWYATAGTSPVFYQLNSSGVKEIQTSDKLAEGFVDIPADAWYANDVKAVLKSGLMQGTDATHFTPQGTLTLGQVVTLAARFHMPQSVSLTTDSPNAKWYQGAYQYCEKYHLLDTQKYPLSSMERLATRFEMVDILDRIFQIRTTVQINPNGSAVFQTSDIDAFLSEYYGMKDIDLFTSDIDYSRYFGLNADYINAVDTIPDVDYENEHFWTVLHWYNMGILAGDSNHNFHGDTTINRAETAAILCRLLGLTDRILIP